MLKRKQTILWRELDGEAVLLNPEGGYSYSLNQVGTLIWSLLDGAHTSADIARAICEDYEVEYEQALQDVDQILVDLLENHLVQDTSETHTAIQDYVEKHPTRTN